MFRKEILCRKRVCFLLKIPCISVLSVVQKLKRGTVVRRRVPARNKAHKPASKPKADGSGIGCVIDIFPKFALFGFQSKLAV